MNEEPRVGIFWSYKNRIFHHQSSPLSEGIKTDISVDYEVGHYAAWFLMDKMGLLKELPETLRYEYDSIPRGRVVYLFKKKCFVLYHGDDITEDEKRTIMKAFKLPEDSTIDDIDMHYNPLPEDFVF
ncbi:MAG: hypothetical protein PF447_04075 [Spirochaetaceae bacterium]|jgi:hypothetical protein|nr:hypothetical protein [Spirochaetaceae bacterium]